jgi:hypothetical protein
MFLNFKRNVYFVCTHTMNVVSLVVGFYELLVFLYYTFYLPLCAFTSRCVHVGDMI